MGFGIWDFAKLRSDAAKRRPPLSQADQLRRAQDEILKHAHAYGLQPFRTVFELVSHDEMNEIASYGGFPTRYPHWRFGMEYEQLSKSYEYGASKIYEMVINNNPSFTYLLEGNS